MQQSLMPDDTTIGTGKKRKKKKKPVQLWYRYAPPTHKKWGLFKAWSRWSRYKTVGQAEKVVADSARKNPGLWDFHIGDKPKGDKK